MGTPLGRRYIVPGSEVGSLGLLNVLPKGMEFPGVSPKLETDPIFSLRMIYLKYKMHVHLSHL